MPIGQVWDVDWLHQNALRRYPLFEMCDCRDITGQFQIPEDFLVDAKISTSSILDPTSFHVSNISVYTYGVTLTLSAGNQAFTTIMVGSGDFTEATQFRNYVFRSTVANGHITIGSLTTIMQNLGSYIFEAAHTRFVPTVVTHYPSGVTGFYLGGNGGTPIGPITGEITIEGGQNIHITTVDNKIRYDAVCFSQYSECTCPDNMLGDPLMMERYVRRINGVPPDNSGNLDLYGSSCIQITPLGDGQIEIKDVCSQSCCGCEELKVIQQAMDDVTGRVAQVQHVAERLQDAQARVQVSAIFSRHKV